MLDLVSLSGRGTVVDRFQTLVERLESVTEGGLELTLHKANTDCIYCQAGHLVGLFDDWNSGRPIGRHSFIGKLAIRAVLG